jgi:hypothetical protein
MAYIGNGFVGRKEEKIDRHTSSLRQGDLKNANKHMISRAVSFGSQTQSERHVTIVFRFWQTRGAGYDVYGACLSRRQEEFCTPQQRASIMGWAP